MNARQDELDRLYRRRLTVTSPLAGAMLAALALQVPSKYVPLPDQARVGVEGPLTILPEVDILPETIEDTRLTAAPAPASPSDFEVFDLEMVDHPQGEPIPRPAPLPVEDKDETLPAPVIPAFQDAIRTTGHPVLAESEYEVVHLERPEYPREAVRRGIEGVVEIVMLVDTVGRVAQVHVVHPNRYPLLEAAAQEAVRKSLFKAYVLNGKPTPFWVRVPFDFQLVN